MKYITRIHRVEAVKYNGSNKRDRDAEGNLMEWVDLYQRCV